jgi:hypothetical protein
MASVTALKDASKAKAVKQQGFNLEDVLASATAAKEAKSTSKTPVLTVGEEVSGMAKRLRELKDEIESKTSEFDSLSADFVEQVEPLRAAYVVRNGFTSSVKVPDGEGKSVSVTFSSNYSKVAVASQGAIEELAGDSFDLFFKKEMEITVKDVTEESLMELVQAVGPERFARFFSVNRWILPTKAYTEQFYTAFDDGQRAALKGVVKQYKPSIKTR